MNACRLSEAVIGHYAGIHEKTISSTQTVNHIFNQIEKYRVWYPFPINVDWTWVWLGWKVSILVHLWFWSIEQCVGISFPQCCYVLYMWCDPIRWFWSVLSFIDFEWNHMLMTNHFTKPCYEFVVQIGFSVVLDMLRELSNKIQGNRPVWIFYLWFFHIQYITVTEAANGQTYYRVIFSMIKSFILCVFLRSQVIYIIVTRHQPLIFWTISVTNFVFPRSQVDRVIIKRCYQEPLFFLRWRDSVQV